MTFRRHEQRSRCPRALMTRLCCADPRGHSETRASPQPVKGAAGSRRNSDARLAQTDEDADRRPWRPLWVEAGQTLPLNPAAFPANRRATKLTADKSPPIPLVSCLAKVASKAHASPRSKVEKRATVGALIVDHTLWRGADDVSRTRRLSTRVDRSLGDRIAAKRASCFALPSGKCHAVSDARVVSLTASPRPAAAVADLFSVCRTSRPSSSREPSSAPSNAATPLG
jgi:hypothetical protein